MASITYPIHSQGRPTNEQVIEAINQARADGHEVVAWRRQIDGDGAWQILVVTRGGE